MSSICSKNEQEVVLSILAEQKILEYFIFPSISWKPKGPRIQDIIEKVQLRAETVLFIDDNPNNLAEAISFSPGIQVCNEKFIPSILSDSRFKGKDDYELSRLKQYKLLETRHQDKLRSTESNEDFLRSCNIRVCIEYDILSNLDRAIELINRTNQLNFTKRRLPEEINEARLALTKELELYDRQAGLIRVADKYGDYGFVGFFMSQNERWENTAGDAYSSLIHYCFSCRTLGMLIEKWVYDFLRRPQLRVSGDVLTDLFETKAINWVSLVSKIEESESKIEKVAPAIVLHGGCEANAIGVYLLPYTHTLTVYGNYEADGMFSRVNTAFMVNETCDRNPAVFSSEAKNLGIPLNLCAVDYFDGHPYGTIFVLNCSRDSVNDIHYRHKTEGWLIYLEPRAIPARDLTNATEDELTQELQSSWFGAERRQHCLEVCLHIKENYTSIRFNDEQRVDAMRKVIERTPAGSKLIITIDHDEVRDGDDIIRPQLGMKKYREQIDRLTSSYEYVGVISFSDVIRGHDDIQRGGNHYNRAVYLNFARHILNTADQIPQKEG